MFEKILVANRGEIACRIIRTARRMGIATVAVHSDVDRTARHVAEADEAVCIGTAAASDSYLVSERIVEACRDTGASAVHPGYGFLSENHMFARLLEHEGMVFIGPGPQAIETMGDKIASKILARQAGVHTIPGHADVVPDASSAVQVAKGIGFPVMIKASAGGGGKGMRVAYDADQCREGFERATSEAVASFGDGRILIERFIEQPRHIEIQILADAHGNVVALNERECSIQRRHQKIIEEAPSPFLDDDTREMMARQAVALAREVGYVSAGTVEFVVDSQRDFYFLEMNTRLQVEHTVTEMTVGLDLVEMMIRVAAGESLPFSQEDIGLEGWAVEARVCAESPLRGFLPSTGRLKAYRPPEISTHVRLDSGVVEGSEISMYYDPLIAKLVTWGKDRASAMDAMREAVDQFHIRGIETNLSFIASILRHPRFRAGDLTTHFIEEEYPDGFVAEPVAPDQLARLVCVLVTIHHRHHLRASTISNQVEGYGKKVGTRWAVLLDGDCHETSIEQENDAWIVCHDNQEYRIEDNWVPGCRVYTGRIEGCALSCQVDRSGPGYEVTFGAFSGVIHVMTPEIARLYGMMPVRPPADLSRYLLSPMPGLLVSVQVAEGQHVKAGEELAVIEAMKMENSLRADHDCVVAGILVEAGATLEVDQPILEFE